MSEEEAEEDWFESAFSDDKTPDGEETAESGTDEGESVDDENAAEDAIDPDSDTETESAGATDEDPDSLGGFEMGTATEETDRSPAVDPSDTTTETAFDPDASVDSHAGTDGADDTDTDEGNLFEDDFASAFQNAPSPDTGLGGGGSGPGGAGAGMGEFGGGGEFGMGEDFGMEEGFEADEDFESDIPRIEIGIEGLDSMIQGGVPERSLMVTIGAPGTGKTTFGLQFLQHALEAGENAVYITLEESFDRVINTADDKGWEFSEYVDNNQLAIVDLDPVEMANSLTSIRSELPNLIQDFGATRLVLDSVSLLEMMYDKQATRRNEIFDFTTSLKAAGVTTMLTSEASEDNPFVSRFGIIEYLTDAVFVLRYIRPDDFRETRLAVEIQKIRDANHSRETKPYEITSEGISVYRQANIF
ncbi:MAG: KaiC domain-containing protein [Halobacteriales archaeon]